MHEKFSGINFWESPISKISTELIFAKRHLRGSKKEFNFENLAEIRENFFPQGIYFSLGMTQTISLLWIHGLCIPVVFGQVTPGKYESTAHD